ncbi:MAG: helicase-related protein [Bacteriovoracaceae bacterium]|jgi:superfamily II DNA or RNA helicase|nr:helicase-related protein [Bacteriovoracaceae bacterium]
MEQINTFLDQGHNTLLIAPTGWGKTTLLLDLVRKSSKRWVYLSPLRALCDEFYLRSVKIKNSFMPRSQKELRNLYAHIEFKLLTLTPELCIDELLFDEDIIWVFDEFHLFYYWGESFRHKILEIYECLSFLERRLLLLSATVSDDIVNKWQNSRGKKVLINLGNHKIKKRPDRIYFSSKLEGYYPFLKRQYATLIFFKYRTQVLEYEKILNEYGFSVVTCLGGESHLFNQKIAAKDKVDFILGTSALSHGVNLPKISVVIISYKVSNLDMWIQMSGRAGRRGESFNLYTQDNFKLSRLQICQKWILSKFKMMQLYSKSFIDELRRFNYS